MIEIFLDSCEEVRASMKFCVCLILAQGWAILRDQIVLFRRHRKLERFSSFIRGFKPNRVTLLPCPFTRMPHILQ